MTLLRGYDDTHIYLARVEHVRPSTRFPVRALGTLENPSCRVPRLPYEVSPGFRLRSGIRGILEKIFSLGFQANLMRSKLKISSPTCFPVPPALG